MNFIIIALLAAVLIVQIVILLKGNKKDDSEQVIGNINELKKNQQELRVEVIKEISAGHIKSEKNIQESLIRIQESTEKRLREDSKNVNETILNGLKSIQEANDRKLTDIQADMSKKLDKNLHERLDESFKQVGERLESLYQSLGELKSLESGVVNLNKTLSNVKARGIYGEMALENLLANILDKNQYETNVATRPRSTERVEFAVKIPDKENKGFIYLPIDSKFPADIYASLRDAQEAADKELVLRLGKELEQRIKSFAKDIRDKYVEPPYTTDFGIMFLPVEGLYAEVVQRGMVETLQREYKVNIAGPSTMAALLNRPKNQCRGLRMTSRTRRMG